MTPDDTPAWRELQQHYLTIKSVHMRKLFDNNSRRVKIFSAQTEDVFLDYSKNRIDQTTMDLLIKLAEESELDLMRSAMFNGEKINFTEQRAAMHTALRNRSKRPSLVEGKSVKSTVKDVLKRLGIFSEKVRCGKWTGYSGKPIKTIINIGIGGSHLGPKLVSNALAQYNNSDLDCQFVSNSNINTILNKVDPETTLFIVVSKSFSTQETITNAEIARSWLTEKSGNKNSVAKHFVAVSANQEATTIFGIDQENVFELWDWVGGRYSLWSSVGLSIILQIGIDQFETLLEGAWRMDEHFRTAPFDQNLPVIMALLGIWYTNFFDTTCHAVEPYDERLKGLPFYLQQLDMESNGKSVTAKGTSAKYNTGPIIIGSVGTDCQHAYFQSLHQGSHLIPVDFIASLQSPSFSKKQHEALLANCFAQSEAMMCGRTKQEILTELKDTDLNAGEIELLAPHKVISGNKPSNTILVNDITPRSFGALLALYEHKVFVQGVIWNINSFDQWGVELGKQLAQTIQRDLNHKNFGEHDCSTENLMRKYRSGKF
ncbi:MAG: glucose-6-phosphate isomerase [Gammaproteobacteria bacterium]